MEYGATADSCLLRSPCTAPSVRDDVALNDLAGVWRLEVHALAALMAAIGMILIHHRGLRQLGRLRRGMPGHDRYAGGDTG